jgi:hypothetical protein
VISRVTSKIATQCLEEELSHAARHNLNLDSSVLARCGNQQGAKRGSNPKKQGQPSQHPVLAFPGSGYVVNVWNRSGDTSTGHGAVPFFRQRLLSLGSDFHGNRVLCDSGFYEIEFITYLEGKRFSVKLYG